MLYYVIWALLTALLQGATANVEAHAGVPYPRSAAEYRQPSANSCAISQGNGGSFSHTDEYNRYAWDYDLPPGSPVVAARAGVVNSVRAKSNIGGNGAQWIPYGNRVVIDHLDGTYGVYLHIQKGSGVVRKGEYVLQGELIAASGDTGWSSMPHLHYSVTDKSGRSLVSRFADFAGKAGVPDKGDRVRASAPPSTAQRLITETKSIFRAVNAAEERELPELALSLCVAAPKKIQDYYYGQVLAAKRDQLEATVLQLIETLQTESAPQLAQMLTAYRLQAALSRYRGKKLAAALKGLDRTLTRWTQGNDQWYANRRARKSWLNAQRAYCLRDINAVVSCYRRAAKTARGPFQKQVQLEFDVLVKKWHGQLNDELKLLERESTLVLPKHKEIVRRNVDQVARDARLLLAAWIEVTPEHRREAKEAQEAVEERVKAIVANLKVRS